MTPVDIHAFLEARLAEDQAIAQWAARTRSGNPGGHWKVDCDCPGPCADDCDEERIDGDNLTIYAEGGHDNWQAQHIARWDPTRVLCEIAAKRAILALHMRGYAEFEDGTRIPFCEDRSADPDFNGDLWAPCLTARLLAAPYADHKDFAPAWSVTP